MPLTNVDLRHVRTGVKLSRAEIADSEYMSLCARTARRQRAAKAELRRRGVVPRVLIGGAWVPPSVARLFTHTNVRGIQ